MTLAKEGEEEEAGEKEGEGGAAVGRLLTDIFVSNSVKVGPTAAAAACTLFDSGITATAGFTLTRTCMPLSLWRGTGSAVVFVCACAWA